MHNIQMVKSANHCIPRPSTGAGDAVIRGRRLCFVHSLVLIKNTTGVKLLTNFKKILRAIRRRLFILFGLRPDLKPCKHKFKLIRLGTSYGGWTFVPFLNLTRSCIVSAGLGLDASFDIEFASKFNARVLIVDPTPRSIQYFERIRQNLGRAASKSFTNDGNQPVEAYDLTNIGDDSLELVPVALWHEETTLKFFLPPNRNDISHSIINYQNKYASEGEHITVQSLPFDELLKKYEIKNLPLVKLDIEGAEREVLLDMMTKRIFPDQILVELDELTVPSRRSAARVREIHAALLHNNYQLVSLDEPNNALYVHSSMFTAGVSYAV